MKFKFYKICPIISVALFLVVWAVSALALNVEFLLPSPKSVFIDIINALSNLKFYNSVLITLWHTFAAYALAFVFAALFSVLASFFKAAEYFLYPIIVIMRVMPTIAVIFLSIVWLSGNKAPFLICFFVCFPLLYSQFLTAIKGVDKGLLQMAKVYRLKKSTVIAQIYVPEIYGRVLSGATSVLSFSLKITIAGEAVSQAAGSLGFMISSANANLETGLLIAYSLVAVLLGFLLEGLVKFVPFAVKKVKEKVKNKKSLSVGEKNMIKLENVTKKYGDLTVFNNFSLEFKSGEVTAILGASGVGKTTILNLLAGITDYSAGKVYTENAVSYVFQSPNLVENLSVYKNAEMVLKNVCRDKEKREKIICDLLKAADICDKKDSPVFTLSGGQKQRVGIVRAFCCPCELMLMDEPFSSLDISLKVRLIDLYARLLSENPRTVIFVSHSESEAVALADRIIVLGNNEVKADFYVDDLRDNNVTGGENFNAKTKSVKPRDEGSENSVSARKKILNCFKISP